MYSMVELNDFYFFDGNMFISLDKNGDMIFLRSRKMGKANFLVEHTDFSKRVSINDIDIIQDFEEISRKEYYMILKRGIQDFCNREKIERGGY